jgi:hypothetical protein
LRLLAFPDSEHEVADERNETDAETDGLVEGHALNESERESTRNSWLDSRRGGNGKGRYSLSLLSLAKDEEVTEEELSEVTSAAVRQRSR